MKTVNITALEAALIGKIYESCFHDGEDPIGNAVWSEIDTQEDKGVMSSLIKKDIVAFWEEKKRGVSVESTNMLCEEYRELIEQLRDNNWKPISLPTKTNSPMATTAAPEKTIFNRADKQIGVDALKMTKPEFVKTYTESTTGDAAKIGTAWHELRNNAAKKPSTINLGDDDAKPEKLSIVKKAANAKLTARQEKDERAAVKATEAVTKGKERDEAKLLKLAKDQEAKTLKAAEKEGAKSVQSAAAKEQAKAEKEAVTLKAAKLRAANKVEADLQKVASKLLAQEVKDVDKLAREEKRKQDRAVSAASKTEENKKGKEDRAATRKLEGAALKEERNVERLKVKAENANQHLIDVEAIKVQKAEEKAVATTARLAAKEVRAQARAKEKAEKAATRKTSLRPAKLVAELTPVELAIANDASKAKSERMRLLYDHNPLLSVRDIALHLDAHYSFTYGVVEKHKMDLRIAKIHEGEQKAAETAAV